MRDVSDGNVVSCLISICALLLITACGNTPKPTVTTPGKQQQITSADFSTLSNSLWSVRNTVPEEAAKSAYDRRERRFLAIMTHGKLVPGLTEEELDKFVTKQGTRQIEGTSAIVFDADQKELMNTAGPYAERYNRKMKTLLEGR